MNPEPDENRVSAEGIELLAWRRGVLFFVLLFVFIVLFVLASGRSADQTQRQHLVIGSLIVMIVAAAAILLAGKRFEKGWSTYRLRFEVDSIVRFRKGLDPMRLRRSEIAKIEDVPRTGLTIRTKARLRRLFIPTQLAGYELVRDVVSQWQTVETLSFSTRALRKGLLIGFIVLCLAASIICLGSADASAVVASAVVFYGVAAVGLAEHTRNPELTTNQKLLGWIVLLVDWKFIVLPFVTMCTVLAR
ncbi:MAG: hypothetical protein ACRD3D_16015 [Terriglobia bacterium]